MAAAAQGAEPNLGIHSSVDTDEHFRTVTPRKKKFKRKREGSLLQDFQPYSGTSTDSESEGTDTTIFGTPSGSYRSTSSNFQNSSENNPNDLKVLIVPLDKSKLLNKVNPVSIAKSINKCIGNSEVQIKPVKSGILVTCKNVKQKRSLFNIDKIGNIPVKVQEIQNHVRGVIYGVPVEMNDEEIINELKSQKVIEAKRMKKKNTSNVKKTDQENPGKEQTNYIPLRCVILSFDRKSLPEFVTMCYQSFQVKQYIPPVIRCYKCQNFGHSITQCRANTRCVRCGGKHSFQDCEQKDTPKCMRCGGNHSAAYEGCTEVKKAKQIQKIKIEQNLSYAQATKAWTAKKPIAVSTTQAPPTETQPQREGTLPTKPFSSQPQPTIKIRETNYPHLPQNSPQTGKGESPEEPTPVSVSNKSSSQDLHGKPETSNPSNIFCSASNDQIIIFLTHMIMAFTEGKTEIEVISFIKTAADKLLNQKLKNMQKNYGN